MSDLKNILRDVGYFSVGAAAVILEAGGKAVKCLVRKGEKVLSENQDTVDEIKRKAKEAGERIKEAARDLSAKEEAPVEEAPAEPVAPDAIYRTDEPAPVEESVEEIIEEAAEDVAEAVDAIANAEDDPKPEETING